MDLANGKRYSMGQAKSPAQLEMIDIDVWLTIAASNEASCSVKAKSTPSRVFGGIRYLNAYGRKPRDCLAQLALTTKLQAKLNKKTLFLNVSRNAEQTLLASQPFRIASL